uniref:Uncharacterized protein n=1 Tax=Echeneis naucrates TaxID=173247 RepID=A0A665WSR2_ECHNA
MVCQLHTKLQHSLGLCWSAPPSPSAHTPPHRARFLVKGPCRLSIWPALCRSQSATQEGPTCGPRRAGDEGWLKQQPNWTELVWSVLGWISWRGKRNWRSEEFKMSEADLSKRREKKEDRLNQERSYGCDLAVSTCPCF